MIRNDIDSLMERTKAFLSRNKEGSALIQVKSIKSISKPEARHLNEWRFPEDLYEYLDARMDNARHYWSERLEVDDDLIPCISPWFGIAEHSAFLGGDVNFSQSTSWHLPVIKDWDDINKLALDEKNPWYRMVIGGIEYLKEISGGELAVKLRGGYSPLDMANALRGNDLFMDFYDNPEEVKKLLDFCVKAISWFMEKQIAAAGSFHYGIITGMDVWLPGNSMGHLSEDTAALCSTDIYKEFGIPYTMDLVKNYKHIFMHTHALGIHTIPDIASIPGIDVIEISNDPNCPRAIEAYKKLEAVLKDKIVVVNLTLDEIRDNLDFLKRMRTIFWYDAADIDDAKAAVALVRREFPA